MMKRHSEPQPPLFHYGFSLEERVRKNHPLREVAALIDFDFAYGEVERFYGAVGHESTPPPMILKLLFLLTYYNVRSERELLETLPERLDWLWFLGLDVDSKIPDHSVLSKARARWGASVFRSLFERVVAQCVRAGVVGGAKVHCDSSLIDANASQDSVEAAICVELTDQVEERLNEAEGDEGGQAAGEDRTESSSKRLRRYSTTDPDAAVVSRRRGREQARPRYKTHRAVDDQHGVITATRLTAGDMNEGHQLTALLDEHEAVTGIRIETVVADSAYGTNENLLACHDLGVNPHVAILKETNNAAAQRERGLFTRRAFRYEAETDTYRCPAGATLKRTGGKPDRLGLLRYRSLASACRACPLKARCTNSDRRSVSRHVRQEALDRIERRIAREAGPDLRRRKTLMEGSFGQATRYGYKRARYRGAERVTIQDLLVATVQNVLILCRYGRGPRSVAQAASATISRLQVADRPISLLRAKTPIFEFVAAAARHLSTYLRAPLAFFFGVHLHPRPLG